MKATATKFEPSQANKELDYGMKVALKEVNKGFSLVAELSDDIPTTFSKLLNKEVPKNLEDYITHKSPLGKAIYKRQVGDTVTVDGPEETYIYKIIDIF